MTGPADVGRTAVLTCLLACGADLARLEVEQQALEREVGVLSRQVAQIRAQMQDMGMLPRGPVGGGVVAPAEGLAGELAFEVTRDGAVPALPALDDPERRPGTGCGWRFFAPWLDAVSDLTLERTGSGRASPIRLLHDGAPLTPHASVVKFERECSGSFRVQPRYIFFSPRSADAVEGAWTTVVNPAIPLPRGGDGRPMYWVFPGTTMTFSFSEGWRTEEWGSFGVRFDARLLAVGERGLPHRQPQAPAEVRVPGQRKAALDNRLGLVAEGPAPRGPWTIEVASPEHGPWVLIETLIVGNEERALVVTAEEAP